MIIYSTFVMMLVFFINRASLYSWLTLLKRCFIVANAPPFKQMAQQLFYIKKKQLQFKENNYKLFCLKNDSQKLSYIL